MPLETATYVNDLNVANPASGDNLQQGDDHLRLIKAVLKAQFPNASAPFDLAATAAAIALLTAKSVPVGCIMDYGGLAAPSGWLLCFGQELLRTTYSLLDTAIAQNFGAYTNGAGGAGTTHLRLPDYRGRVGAGQDDMGGVSANRLTNPAGTVGGIDGDAMGGVGGEEAHVQTAAQMVTHTHVFTGTPLAAHGHPFRVSTAVNVDSDGNGGMMLAGTSSVNRVAFVGTPSSANGEQIGGQGAGTPAGTNANAGSGTGFNVVQPTLIVNKIIFTGV